MKIPIVLVFLIGVFHAGNAAAPATFSGGLYREQSNRFRGSPTQTIQWRYAFILNADGTFVNIYGAGSTTGQWSYLRDTADTAMLRIGDLIRSLRFTDGTSGDWSSSQDGTVHESLFTLEARTSRSLVVNTSTLSFVRPSASALCGFVVGPEGAWALVRAIGPSLAQFGILSGLPRPVLQVTRNIPPSGRGSVQDFASSHAVESPARPKVPTASEIIRQASVAVGAFPLSSVSADSATLVLLPAGAYTAEVRDVDPTRAGEVLIEVYFVP